ncbi:Putative transposase (identified by ISEscan HMM) [Escherichia coli]|nr:Putative transposase (identified by ISEscan HMM) [Escherichia coli]
MNYRSALVELVADQLKVGVELERVRPAGADPARAPERAANRVRFPALHHEPLPAGRPDADRAGDANRQRHRAGQRLDRAPAAAVGHSARPQRRRAGECRGDHPCNRRIYDALAEPLADAHRRRLDDLLKRRDNGKTTWLAWLRQSPAKPNSRHMLEHIERLKAWQALDLPTGIERLVHQNRLLKIAREGGQMTPADGQIRAATALRHSWRWPPRHGHRHRRNHRPARPHPGKLFNAAKNKHQQQFQASGKAINAKVRLYGRIGQALIDAKQSGRDAFAAIEAVMSRFLCRERHRGAEARATR